MEIWKEIKGYEGLYYASSHGRIKSCVKKKEKILKGVINANGYYRIALYKNGKQKIFSLHQLIAIAFLDHEICGMEKVVNHIDFNRINNRVDNLEIISSRENTNQKHKESSSKYTGVYWVEEKQKWYSGIHVNKTKIHLGQFDTEIEASKYYEDALVSLSKNEPIKIKRSQWSSVHKGVTWDKKRQKWAAAKEVKGKKYHLGRFDNELDAAEAYKKAQQNIDNGIEAIQKRQYSSIHKGISFNKNEQKWICNLHANGTRKFIGLFKTEAEALAAQTNNSLINK
jgi:hypothetical protein